MSAVISASARFEGDATVAGRATVTITFGKPLSGANKLPADYSEMSTSPLVNFLSPIMANPDRQPILPSKRSKTLLMKNFRGKKHLLIHDDFEISVEVNESLRCSRMAFILFLVALFWGCEQGWRDSRVRFNLRDIQTFIGADNSTATHDYLRKQFRTAVWELTQIVVSITTRTTKGSRIFNSFGAGSLLAWGECELRTGECYLEFSASVVSALSRFHQLFPMWAGRVGNARGLHLISLIFFRLRMSQTPGVAIIQNRDILVHLGLPTEKKEIASRNYQREMVKPVQDAIASIAAAANHQLEIISEHGSGIDRFLNGKTRFQLTDPDVIEYYRRTSISKETPVKSQNKQRKAKPKNSSRG